MAVEAGESEGPPLIRQTTPGKLPPFIVSLLPEGWLETVLKDKDERALLRSGKRYMSNITIVEREAELATLPQDILLTRLRKYMQGRHVYRPVCRPGPQRDRGRASSAIWRRFTQRADTPRLSGVQIKAPMYLDSEGILSPSTGKPFTHILKPAGTSGYDALPLVEWAAMALGRAAGLETPDVALVDMPDGMPPALLVERFDIRESLEDTRMLALEDLCSVLDLPTDGQIQRHDGTRRARRAPVIDGA